MNILDITSVDVSQAGWLCDDDSYLYPIKPMEAPRPEDLKIVSNIHVQISLVLPGLSLTYRVRPLETASPKATYDFHGRTALFLTNGLNSGHFLSDIVSFANFYRDYLHDERIAISEDLVERVPFIFSLFRYILPNARFVPLKRDVSYSFEQVIFRKNHWFIFMKNWEEIEYAEKGDYLHFRDLEDHANVFSSSTTALNELVRSIYADNAHRYERHEKIALLKASGDISAQSPGRGLSLTGEARETAQQHGLLLLDIKNFSTIEEYICTLRSAKKVLLSYGSTTCTNRFFLNPDAHVVVVGHEAYKSEYERRGVDGKYSHIRHSHLCPVRSQGFCLGFPDLVNSNAIERLLVHVEED